MSNSNGTPNAHIIINRSSNVLRLAGASGDEPNSDAQNSDDAQAASGRQRDKIESALHGLFERVRNGDASAVLQPACIAELAAIRKRSNADFQDVRRRLKASNTAVSLSQLDAAIKAHVADGEAPPTHHGYANDIVNSLTVDGFPPVGHEGGIYVADPEKGIWRRLEPEQLQTLVAQTHDGAPNCKRRTDYVGIAMHAASLVSNADFFDEAPVGLACSSGFHRVVGDETIVEALTPAHRQRVLIDVVPRDEPKPLFDALLHETFASPNPDEEHQQIRLVQEIAGGIMLGTLAPLQKAVLFYEPYGRAGKGTLESIIRRLLPREAVTAVSPFSWNKEYFLASLAGARLNSVGELPDDQAIPAAQFKSVLGRDLVTGRNPTHRPITFRNEAAHLFMSNHLPLSRDQSEAFFARWQIVEFPNSRLKSGLPIDPGLAQRIIESELPAIAFWALEGAKRLQVNKGFSASSAHDRIVAQWRRGNSSLEEFIHENCELGAELSVRRAALYKYYKRWCEENGRKPFSKSKVKELLEHNVGLGITLCIHYGYELFRGVQLKPDEDILDIDF